MFFCFVLFVCMSLLGLDCLQLKIIHMPKVVYLGVMYFTSLQQTIENQSMDSVNVS